MRKLIAALFVSALLLSPHSSILQAQADATARVRGVIRAVDLVAGTVAIHSRSDETVVLKTDENTHIVRNGEPARLEDLQPGDRATALYDPESLLAAEIVARGEQVEPLARVEGVISAVDTGASTVTILAVRDLRASTAAPEITVHVTANTAITLDGRPASLGDLKRGYSAGAAYNRHTFEAARIAAESFAEVRGIVRDVGPQSLTIWPSSGEPAITLIVGPAIPISLNGRPATLEDLKRGYKVVAAYVESTLDAVRIAAQSLGEVVGHIREVDVAWATVVIAPLVEGPAVELQVTHSTIIAIGGERVPLDRLQPGMPAKALFNIVSFEALLIEARPLAGDPCTELRVKGAIAGVDIGSSTITIALPDPAGRLTLILVERTEITLNGNPARLADLREGMRVVAVFCRETQVAKSIAARAR